MFQKLRVKEIIRKKVEILNELTSYPYLETLHLYFTLL